MNPPSENAFKYANSLVNVYSTPRYNERFTVSIPHLQIEYGDNYTTEESELVATGAIVKLAQLIDEFPDFLRRSGITESEE